MTEFKIKPQNLKSNKNQLILISEQIKNNYFIPYREKGKSKFPIISSTQVQSRTFFQQFMWKKYQICGA